jgi:hypothetical protein
MRPKPAYFTIKRELDTVTVGIQRTVQKNRENDRPRQFYECECLSDLQWKAALLTSLNLFRWRFSEHERDDGRLGNQQLHVDHQL